MNDAIIRAIARAEAGALLQPYGYVPFEIVTTSDATPTNIAVIPVEEYTSGIFWVEVVGLKDDGSLVYTVVKIGRWRKDTSLTLGTVSDILLAEDDFSGASILITTASNDIAVEATATASDTIDWTCRVQILSVKATVLP